MNHLQTIPQLSYEAAQAAISLAPSWRARAHRSLRAAIDRGTLPKREVTRACKLGERGIAALMVEHCALPNLPEVPRGAFKAVVARSANTKALRAIAGFARAMKAAGLIRDEDASLTARSPLEDALDLFQTGLERIHARVEAQLPALQGKFEKGPYRPFAIEFPQVDLRHFAHDYRLNRQGEEETTLVLYLVDTPMSSEPRVQSEEDIAALSSALSYVSRASKLGLFIHADDVVQAVCPYQYELAQDIAADSTWTEDGRLVCGKHARQLLEEELGIDPANEPDPDQFDEAIQYIADVVRFVQAPARKVMGPRSRQFLAWRETNKGSRLDVLIGDLLAIGKKLESLPSLPRNVESEPEGDVAAILVLPTNNSLPEFLSQGFDHYGESGETIAVNFDCGPGNYAQLLELYERVLIEASLVTAAMNVIDAYE